MLARSNFDLAHSSNCSCSCLHAKASILDELDDLESFLGSCLSYYTHEDLFGDDASFVDDTVGGR